MKIRKKSKQEQGITLVALVVTIIVLLILAAVSLSLVAGSDGLLNRASNAVEKTSVASAKERSELEIETAIADYYYEKYVDNTTMGSMVSETIPNYVSGKINNKDVGNGATVTVSAAGVVTLTVPGQAAAITGTLTSTGNLTWTN